jgi:hypothetical protein
MTDKTKATTEAAPGQASTPQVVYVRDPANPAQIAAENMLKGRELNMDETVPGGRYLRNGVAVDANGDPVKEPVTE